MFVLFLLLLSVSFAFFWAFVCINISCFFIIFIIFLLFIPAAIPLLYNDVAADDIDAPMALSLHHRRLLLLSYCIKMLFPDYLRLNRVFRFLFFFLFTLLLFVFLLILPQNYFCTYARVLVLYCCCFYYFYCIYTIANDAVVVFTADYVVFFLLLLLGLIRHVGSFIVNFLLLHPSRLYV